MAYKRRNSTEKFKRKRINFAELLLIYQTKCRIILDENIDYFKDFFKVKPRKVKNKHVCGGSLWAKIDIDRKIVFYNARVIFFFLQHIQRGI